MRIPTASAIRRFCEGLIPLNRVVVDRGFGQGDRRVVGQDRPRSSTRVTSPGWARRARPLSRSVLPSQVWPCWSIVGDHQAGAFTRERASGGTADASAGPGHERDLVGEPSGLVLHLPGRSRTSSRPRAPPSSRLVSQLRLDLLGLVMDLAPGNLEFTAVPGARQPAGRALAPTGAVRWMGVAAAELSADRSWPLAPATRTPGRRPRRPGGW